MEKAQILRNLGSSELSPPPGGLQPGDREIDSCPCHFPSCLPPVRNGLDSRPDGQHRRPGPPDGRAGVHPNVGSEACRAYLFLLHDTGSLRVNQEALTNVKQILSAVADLEPGEKP